VSAPIQNAGVADGWNADVFAGVADTTAAPARADTVAAAAPAPADTTPAGPARAASSSPPAMPWVDPAAKPAPEVAQTVPNEPAPAPVEGKKPEPKKPAEEPERFREGYLLVTVEPSAQVYVNGVYRGLANPRLRLTLNAGLHSIECRSEKYATYTESLRIIAGETSQRTVMLSKLKGIISLATQPGAELYIDGAFVGITPIMRPIEVEAGTHTLTLKKQDHLTWSSDVTIEPNATLPLRITLSPRY
jgi:hypothetical protein